MFSEVKGSYIHLGETDSPMDRMTWPNPTDPEGIQWRLRYGTPTQTDLLVAASFMGAYATLINLPSRVRARRVAMILDALSIHMRSPEED